MYFCLTLFDYLERAKAKDGLDIATFGIYDKAIGASKELVRQLWLTAVHPLGVLTIFPLFFYCAAILLLARVDVLPLTTSRPYNRLIQITLVATTPLILLFNELAGLLGITYRKSSLWLSVRTQLSHQIPQNSLEAEYTLVS